MGSTLLDLSIELAAEGGAAWLTAAVGARNVAGRLLLERRGFRPRAEPLDAVYRLVPAAHRPAGPAPPRVVVRPGEAHDLEAVWGLYRQAFPIGRRPQELWARWLEAEEVLVAELDGSVAAFAHVEPGARWITHVGVAEEARGLGVGGYLFSHALEDYWRSHPDQELRLTVIPSNTPAIRLYRRLGFAPWLLLEVLERQV
jgi:ribosomal protein S18 acetylase RimI-like enzyme